MERIRTLSRPHGLPRVRSGNCHGNFGPWFSNISYFTSLSVFLSACLPLNNTTREPKIFGDCGSRSRYLWIFSGLITYPCPRYNFLASSPNLMHCIYDICMGPARTLFVIGNLWQILRLLLSFQNVRQSYFFLVASKWDYVYIFRSCTKRLKLCVLLILVYDDKTKTNSDEQRILKRFCPWCVYMS